MTKKEIKYKIINNCWICSNFSKNKKGYLSKELIINNKRFHTSLHRYIFCIYNNINIKKLNKKIFIMHKCDNPSCINPKHLVLGDNKINQIDKLNKNRQCRGEMHQSSKLKVNDIKFIRKSTLGIRELGRKFNVAHTTILRIKQFKNWKKLNKRKYNKLELMKI